MAIYNRKDKRKLDKLLKGMNSEEKKHILLATQQTAVTKALEDVYPQVIQHGMQAAYIIIYDTFLKPIQEGKFKTNEEKQEQLNKMISHINTNYLKAMQAREKAQADIAQRKGAGDIDTTQNK